jgi:hypothetical protein
MKRIYLRFITLLVVSSLGRLDAQLSGVYTINSAAATGSGNYQTFTAFASALNSSGVSGPVTVNVVSGSGPYSEQVNFTQAAGVSSTNTITINGNGCTLTFNATNVNLKHTLMLSGADYMTFNNLNVIGTNGTYAFACHLWNSADNNTFNSCLFDSPIVGTGTGLCPFSASGSSITVASSGDCGDNNTVNSCTMTGGYYSTVFYGSSAAPFNTGNTVKNSVIRDFYTYGCYNLYCQGTTMKNNIVERVNRTTVTTTYAMYMSTGSTANEVIDGNHIRNLFNGIQGSTSTAYCIYVTADASLGAEHQVKNNLVSNINSNGTIYGIYMSGAAFANVFHNTVSLDDQTSTAGTCYGIYASGPNDKVMNNIVTVARTGTGSHYGLYFTTASTNLETDFNNIYVNSTQGTNYTAYLSTGYISLADWQLAYSTYDQSSKDVDPGYTNPTLLNYVPTSTVINNMCPYIGVATDIVNFQRSLATPDPGAYEFYITPCSGIPGANSVVTPTFMMCPGATLNIGLANTFTNTGYIVQWQSSTTTSLGPYTAISGATLSVYKTPTLNVTTYYNAVITCTVSAGTVTASAGEVLIASTTIDNVPYYEGFEGISKTNQLPNCSWSASNPGTTNLTFTTSNTNLRVPHTGTKFASFDATPIGTSYFYSNGINLVPGITYSAALWYITETVNYNNWSELSILVNTVQAPAGASNIASVSPVAPMLYQSLSNTFVVNSPGVYYIAVKATSGGGVSPYLTWDDLSVTIPCSFNAPTINLSASASTICSGQDVNIIATGANSYTWNTGSNSATVTEVPVSSFTYIAVGQSSLSGCTSTVSHAIHVNTSPLIVIAANSTLICSGSTANLTAQGPGQYLYSWAHGVNGPFTSVNPNVTTTYSVSAVDAQGCAAIATLQVVVNQLPVVTGSTNAGQLCIGEKAVLNGSGGVTYQWTNDMVTYLAGNPVTVTPQYSSTYTMTATDNNGCSNTSLVVISVDECTGIDAFSVSGFRVYPNPTHGRITIESPGDESFIEITDITGRIVFNVSSRLAKADLSGLPAGMYLVKVTSGKEIKVARIILE